MSYEHVQAVHAIEKAIFPTPWSLEVFLVELVKPESDWYVALEGDEPPGREVVGYVGLSQMADVGHLVNLAVRPANRRAGVGTVLLDRALQAARERGLVEVTLEVRDSNLEARRFYEDMGFAVVGRRRGYYTDTKEDAVLMTVAIEGAERS